MRASLAFLAALLVVVAVFAFARTGHLLHADGAGLTTVVNAASMASTSSAAGAGSAVSAGRGAGWTAAASMWLVALFAFAICPRFLRRA